MPLFQCLLRRTAPRTDVPGHPPDQADIRQRHTVVVIEVQNCQRTDIDAEFFVVRDSLRQLRIQGVDPFDHNRLILFRPRDARPVSLGAGNKIKDRHIHRFSVQQIIHLGIEQIQVHCRQVFEIQLAVFIRDHVTPFDKIIIGSHVKRTHPVDPQLDTQPLRESRFTGSGRTRDQDDPASVLLDLIRDPGDLFFMVRFGNEEEVTPFPGFNLPVELVDIIDFRDFTPFQDRIKRLVKFPVIPVNPEIIRVRETGYPQDHLLVIRNDFKNIHCFRGLHQRIHERFGIISIRIDIDILYIAGTDKIRHPVTDRGRSVRRKDDIPGNDFL